LRKTTVSLCHCWHEFANHENVRKIKKTEENKKKQQITGIIVVAQTICIRLKRIMMEFP
jgi:hypothetical protein